MPRPTGAELSAHRLASGNLGGRPRRVTPTEAREAALDRLLPRALQHLERQLDEGGPGATRAAIEIVRQAFGNPEQRIAVAPVLEVDDATDLRTLTDQQLTALRHRLLDGGDRSPLSASAGG